MPRGPYHGPEARKRQMKIVFHDFRKYQSRFVWYILPIAIYPVPDERVSVCECVFVCVCGVCQSCQVRSRMSLGLGLLTTTASTYPAAPARFRVDGEVVLALLHARNSNNRGSK
jgi:hypothetical protein